MAVTTSPYELIAAELKTIVDTEFASEHIVLRKDRLHESLGLKRADVGVHPVEERPLQGDINTSQHELEVRFMLPWKKEISPETMVDPSTITRYAERFKVAIRNANHVRGGLAWYYTVDRLWYPGDPTGNNTRFFARLTVTGNNVAYLPETMA